MNLQSHSTILTYAQSPLTKSHVEDHIQGLYIAVRAIAFLRRELIHLCLK